MTEQEWLTSVDPVAMLKWLQDTSAACGFLANRHDGHRYNGGPSDRKLRLFACACCRQVWDGQECAECEGSGKERSGYSHTVPCRVCHGTGKVGGLTDSRSRNAVEVAEQFADGLATIAEFRETWGWTSSNTYQSFACHENIQGAVSGIANGYVTPCLPHTIHAALLRDIFGNPFRPVVQPKAGGNCPKCGGSGRWRSGVHFEHEKICAKCDWFSWEPGELLPFPWLTPIVRLLAQTIYDDRAFDRMPTLGDALEEAGCTNDILLMHCRDFDPFIKEDKAAVTVDLAPRYKLVGWKPHLIPHARGCWVLDLILGKE